MRKVFILMVISFVLPITMSLSNVFASENEYSKNVQPRAYVADVLDFYDTYTFWSGGKKTSYDYNKTYKTIRYLKTYTYTTKVTDISSTGDKLAGNIRTRTKYTYKTN